MKEIIVDKKYDGKKLNSFLLDSFDGLKLNTLYKALRKKDVRVNDTRISDNVIIHSGDVIKMSNYLVKIILILILFMKMIILWL